MDIQFSIIIPVFNEEKRIISLIKSLVGFCDDIIIINKSSTDSTKKIVNDSSFDKVKVVDVPYSERGIDDFKSYCTHSKFDWVFVCVASEIVKAGFWLEMAKQIEQRKLLKYDLIMIPRLYYCFGVNVTNSPWDVSYFPFFFNKNRVVFSDKLHEHFTVKTESKRYYMRCEKESMLLHLTHQSVDGFIKNTLNYAAIEVESCSKEEQHHLLMSWVKQIREGMYKMEGTSGADSLMHFAAWNLYWSTSILMLCESSRESSGDTLYKNIRVGGIDGIQDTSVQLDNEYNYLKQGGFDRILFRGKTLLKVWMIKSPLLRLFIYKCKESLLRR